VPEAVLADAGRDLLTQEERSFWEVTDRQLNLEWVPPEGRPHLQGFLDLLRSPREEGGRVKSGRAGSGL
jgi:hypothetical protein